MLHRDVKPANILIDPYGRPRLADFSLSLRAAPADVEQDALFGGALAYMATEHLDAFNPASSTETEAVDQRSDIYSLGVVLFELVALELPHPAANRRGRRIDGAALDEMSRQRREPPAALRTRDASLLCLDTTVARCLAGSPAGSLCRRRATGGRARRFAHLQPRSGGFRPRGQSRLVERAPLGAAIPIAFLPHVLGNLFTPSYNFLILSPRLDRSARRC